MKTTKAQRERLAAMWAKATPRPWSWWTSCSYNRLTSDATLQDGGVLRGVTYKDGQTGIEGPVDDMALIVAAVNALPDMLDDLREAEKTAFASTKCECPHCKCGMHRREARAFLREKG